MKRLKQVAPYPEALEKLVESCAYRPGWTLQLEDFERDPGSAGLTLVVTTCGYNAYHTDLGETYRVNHFFPVPPATYDKRSWQRWLFEQLLLVERHEAMEFFQVDGVRPYAPSHGPGNDPYVVRELGTELDQKTRFTGEVVK